MALYKPDCDSNDCELPSQALPSLNQLLDFVLVLLFASKKLYGALFNAMGGLKLFTSCSIVIFSCISSNSSTMLRCERHIVISFFTSLGVVLCLFKLQRRCNCMVYLSKNVWWQLRLAGCWQVDLWLEILTHTHLNNWHSNVIVCAFENTCWAFQRKGHGPV